MHPDLYFRIYQQQEREFEQRLLHRLAARDRARADRARVSRFRLTAGRAQHRSTPHG